MGVHREDRDSVADEIYQHLTDESSLEASESGTGWTTGKWISGSEILDSLKDAYEAGHQHGQKDMMVRTAALVAGQEVEL